MASDTPPPGADLAAMLQICILPSQSASDPTNAADWASSGTLSQATARWRVVITNTGTLALTSIYAADALARTDCGGFVTSSLAPGAVTQYECQTNNVTQTTVNTMTATGNTPSGVPVTSAASSATAVVSSGGGAFVPGTAFGTGDRVTPLRARRAARRSVTAG